MTISNTIHVRPSAIIGHSYWGRGGAEVVAMWTMEALISDFNLTVLTRGGFDLDELNGLAGTHILPNQLDVQIDTSANCMPLGALAHTAYLRNLKQAGVKYDLRITASGVMVWGRPALHFISSVTWNRALAKTHKLQTSPSIRRLRQWVSSMLIYLTSNEAYVPLDGDIFIVNSDWTKRHSDAYSPRRVDVVYPPVTFSGRNLPWDEREDVVLVFGRIAQEKGIETCVRIVELARSRGFSGRLVIAGSPDEETYAASITELCEERRDWVELLSAQVGQAKEELLGSVRYGLSACRVEAFGIATAEMTLAGALVIVPQDCGQTEIVTDTRLHYDTDIDAAERLVALQENSSLRASVLGVMSGKGNRFSPEHYMQSVRNLAQKMIGT